MKKMIFSAVALIAFSFAGMANQIEEKKVEEKKVEKKIIVTDCDQCQQWADGQVTGSDPTNKKWMAKVDECYDKNKCDNLRFRDADL